MNMGKHLANSNKHEIRKKEAEPGKEKEKKIREIHIQLPVLSAPGVKLPYITLALSLVLLAALQIIRPDAWKGTAAYALAFILAAGNVLLTAMDKLSEREYLSDELLTLLSALMLFCTGLYFEAVLLLLLFRVGRMLIRFFDEKSRREYDQISAIKPDSAKVETPDGIVTVSPESLQVGDIFVVNPGEMIPLDGVITEGITTIDTALISGQSSPWAVSEKYRVYSGCMNLTSPIHVRATKSFEQSTACRLVELAGNAAEFRSSQENTLQKLCKLYPIIVAALTILAGFFVPLLKSDWLIHIQRAAVILLAASPALFAVTVPFSYRKGLGLSTKNGVFMKGADCIESVSRAESVIFDKTGTITEGRYTITEVFPENISERDLIFVAAAAELHSRHPIARALREAAGKIDGQKLKISPVEEIPGRGVSTFVGSRQIYVGNTFYLEEHGIKCAVPLRSGAAVHVAADNRYCGYIMVTDKVRRGAFDSLENLRTYGVKKLILLTGDVLSVARPIASRLNFDMLRAELTYEEKVSAVEYLMSNKGERSAVAFIGDGVRDAEIVRRVNVGIAMGALGSEEAYTHADVLIMDRDIRKLPWIFHLSKRVFNVAFENMTAGFILNLLIIILGGLGIISAAAAIIAQFVMLLAVLFNTTRIK